MALPSSAFCVGCGRIFRPEQAPQVSIEVTPLGTKYPMGVCPDCKELADAVEAAVAPELTEAQKRYIGKQDEDALKRASLGDQLADLMAEVWREEEWDKTERRIDQQVNLTDAQERAKKRGEK